MENMWEPYHEYLLRKEWESEAERKIFIKNGLGWLVEFLDNVKKSKEKDENTIPSKEE